MYGFASNFLLFDLVCVRFWHITNIRGLSKKGYGMIWCSTRVFTRIAAGISKSIVGLQPEDFLAPYVLLYSTALPIFFDVLSVGF